MAVFNYAKKEIDAKVVYYGPAISGKTTNLQFTHQHLKPDQRGKMVSLATNEDRTLFFDFLPIELESVRGFKTRFHLYTVPGQVYYGATRRAVLTGADGVVFVADSHAERMEDNLASFKDLEDNLKYYGKKLETTPLVIQYNKRDLPDILSVDELNQKINRINCPYFESVAITGKGVFETLTMACRMVLKAIENGVDSRRSTQTGEKASSTMLAKGLHMEKGGGPQPEVSAPAQPLAAKGLRMEKGGPQPEISAPGQPLAPKGLRLEKGGAHPVTSAPGQPLAAKGLRMEKGGAQPVTSTPGQPLAPKGLRMEKGGTHPIPSVPASPLAAKGMRMDRGGPQPETPPLRPEGIPAKGLTMEKDGAPLRPAQSALETPRARALRQEKDVAAMEIPQTSEPFVLDEEKPEVENKFAGSTPVASRMPEKRRQDLPFNPEKEKGATKKAPGAKETLRILSCGQPRVLSSSSFEVPLTLEVNGSEKSVPLNINLSIRLDQIDPKVD